MAEAATAENITDQEVNFDALIDDLNARVTANEPMKEAKGDYDALCKSQNERAGYNKKAMNWLTALKKMSGEKFQDVMRTLRPGLDMLDDHRSQEDTQDFLDGDNVTTISR